jgi:hypothetical protein
MRLFSRLWLVFSFVIVSFVWADHAFSQSCQDTGMWCPYPGNLEGKYPDCQCVYPPPPKCGPCDIQMGHLCVPATCPPPGFTQNVPATRGGNRSLRPRVMRNIDYGCLGECTQYCSPAWDCRGLSGAALRACQAECQASCNKSMHSAMRSESGFWLSPVNW